MLYGVSCPLFTAGKPITGIEINEKREEKSKRRVFFASWAGEVIVILLSIRRIEFSAVNLGLLLSYSRIEISFV